MSVVCSKCGKKLDIWDLNGGYGITNEIGYGSRYDGEKLDLKLCCDCLDELIESCEISPIK